MSVILTDPEAAIAAEAISGYVELRQLVQRHAAGLSAILGTSELVPMSPTALEALEHLLTVLRRTTAPPRDQLGGDAVVLGIVARAGDTATTAWVAGELEVPEAYAELWLNDLQSDELVRELLDGHGHHTWELTEKGHNTR